MAKRERVVLGGKLGDHVFGTYISLRWGLAALAFLFPPALYFLGKFVYGLPLQSSMSAYFFAADATMCTTFPMRTIFVGTLCSIALGLYLYKGFSDLENNLLNLAAISGVIVAVCPERLDPEKLGVCEGLKDVARAQADQLPWHFIAAVTLLLLFAAVSWFCSSQTLDKLPDAHKGKEKWFRRAYKTLAILMIIFPATGLALNFIFRTDSQIFFIELAAIWTFGAYWFVKSREMNLSEAEFHELKASRTRS